MLQTPPTKRILVSVKSHSVRARQSPPPTLRRPLCVRLWLMLPMLVSEGMLRIQWRHTVNSILGLMTMSESTPTHVVCLIRLANSVAQLLSIMRTDRPLFLCLTLRWLEELCAYYVISISKQPLATHVIGPQFSNSFLIRR